MPLIIYFPMVVVKYRKFDSELTFFVEIIFRQIFSPTFMKYFNIIETRNIRKTFEHFYLLFRDELINKSQIIYWLIRGDQTINNFLSGGKEVHNVH